MSLFTAWVIFPLVLLVLCAGLGLLADALCGRRLPGALIPPLGLAAVVVAGQFTTSIGSLAELTVPVLVFGATLGFGLALPWRFGRPAHWPALAAVGVFLAFGAPVIFSGEPTFAGYVKLDDTATWFALTDRVMEHGRNLGSLAPSSYRATLEVNLPGGYPIGAFVPLGAAQKLTGGDLAWVFQPYLSFLAAMLSLCLWEIMRAVRRPRLRALLAFVAAQPALLYGYAMWGGVKELAAAVLVALCAALAPLALGRAGLLREVVPLALAAAGLVGVLSLGGLVWIAPLLIALAVLAWRRFGASATAGRGLAFAVALLAFVTPTLVAGGFDPFQSGLTSENELGNLSGSLSGFQLLGIWPAGDFRLHPDAGAVATALIVLAIGAGLFGLWSAWRRRIEQPLLYATALLACAAIVVVGSPWVGAKALATAAPIALSLALLGALAALRINRLAGAALVVALAGGVLWSNLLAYGGVSLAPYGQLHELEQIGHDLAGQGPTLMTEYNPYGARHFLREADGEGASELRNRAVPLVGGGEPEKGEAVDADLIEPAALFGYRNLVLRRGPLTARPPLPYRLVHRGAYYEIWQRPDGASPPIAFLPLGDDAAPAAIPDCGEVKALTRRAGSAGATRLEAARPVPAFDATAGSFSILRPGRYTAWLGGSVRGSVALYVDGDRLGGARQQIENQGGFVDLGGARLAAGEHSARLSFGGADLHPGSGGFPRLLTGPLLISPTGAEGGQIVSVPASEAERLCGKPWDWIEIYG